LRENQFYLNYENREEREKKLPPSLCAYLLTAEVRRRVL